MGEAEQQTTSTEPETGEGGDHERIAGVLIPIFSIRRDDDLGIGDVKGLRELIDWAAETGFGFLQLLPINETGYDNSPYNAVSSVALEPMTLDCSPEALEDLDREAFDEALEAFDIDAMRRGPVHYDKVRPLKLDLLWRASATFFAEHYQKRTARDVAFHQFCEQEKVWLGHYCVYRLLMDMEGGKQNWQTWSEDFNTLDKAYAFIEQLLDAEPVKTERQLAYYAYVQWVAHEQWRDTRAYADDKKVLLMGDMPYGVSLASADVFGNPGLFDLEWSGGAPPETNFKDDEFTIKWGQNWGIPLYKWDVMEQDGYAWWRQRVRKVSEIFSICRIDHALGFYRIYAFPFRPERNQEFLPLTHEQAKKRTGGRLPGFKPHPDDTPEQKADNRKRGEKYLSMLQNAVEGLDIVAEDLGFVPDYVVPSLLSIKIPGMKVPQWEWKKEGGGLVEGKDYPYISFATYATHDHVPMKLQWDDRRDVALKGEDSDQIGLGEAQAFLQWLSVWAGIDPQSGPDGTPPVYGDFVRETLMKALFASNSKYAAVMITDLLGLEDRINVPGVHGSMNWAYRLESTAEDLLRNPHWSFLCSRVKKLLIETGRALDSGAGDEPEGEADENEANAVS